MTDQEKDLALNQPQDDETSDDFVRDDARTVPGEEIDPDSLRPVPPVDEDGEEFELILDDTHETM